MIEINLLEKKKTFKAPVVLGIDLGKLPWKQIIVSVLIVHYGGGFYNDYLNGIVKVKQDEVNQLNTRYRKLKTELRSFGDIKAQLKAFNDQIERLKERSEQVDNIIKLKTNPRYLLENIARSTPGDLWFQTLNLSSENKVSITGGADSYQSIGKFISSVNESPFFGGSLKLANSQTEEESVQGVKFRVETFVIEGNVEVYDPYKVVQ